MPGFLTCGPDYFAGWVSIVFSVGLALGIVRHLPCLMSGHGNRWFHAGHTAMALSMSYMYLSMSYRWNWLPATWQMWFFVATSLAITAYLLTNVIRTRPVNVLWILLLVQHAAMAYMWFPTMRWNAIVIFVLVSWFAIETFGWAANLFPDDVRSRENRRRFAYELGPSRDGASTAAARKPVAVMTDGAVAPPTGDAEPTADASGGCPSSSRLVASDLKDRTSMAIMTLSMGYMFYGMQLLR